MSRVREKISDANVETHSDSRGQVYREIILRLIPLEGSYTIISVLIALICSELGLKKQSHACPCCLSTCKLLKFFRVHSTHSCVCMCVCTLSGMIY